MRSWPPITTFLSERNVAYFFRSCRGRLRHRRTRSDLAVVIAPESIGTRPTTGESHQDHAFWLYGTVLSQRVPEDNSIHTGEINIGNVCEDLYVILSIQTFLLDNIENLVTQLGSRGPVLVGAGIRHQPMTDTIVPARADMHSLAFII